MLEYHTVLKKLSDLVSVVSVRTRECRKFMHSSPRVPGPGVYPCAVTAEGTNHVGAPTGIAAFGAGHPKVPG